MAKFSTYSYFSGFLKDYTGNNPHKLEIEAQTPEQAKKKTLLFRFNQFQNKGLDCEYKGEYIVCKKGKEKGIITITRIEKKGDNKNLLFGDKAPLSFMDSIVRAFKDANSFQLTIKGGGKVYKKNFVSVASLADPIEYLKEQGYKIKNIKKQSNSASGIVEKNQSIFNFEIINANKKNNPYILKSGSFIVKYKIGNNPEVTTRIANQGEKRTTEILSDFIKKIGGNSINFTGRTNSASFEKKGEKGLIQIYKNKSRS